MILSGLDHALAFVLLVVFPFFGKRNFERFRLAVKTGGPGARRTQYWRIIGRQWVLALAVIAFWLFAGRPLELLGLALPGGLRAVVGFTVTALLLSALLGQVRSFRSFSHEEVAARSPAIDDVADLLPHTDGESAVFRGVAVTAGICEEIIYRGFLIAYLASFVPVWPAAVIAGVGFGLAHAYQGPAGMMKTGATGLVTGLLYVGTGSLLWPMMIHAGLDLHGGAIGRRVLDVSRAGAAVSAPVAAP